MILTCPNCFGKFEDNIEHEKLLLCPFCKTKWIVRKRKKENMVCYLGDRKRPFRDFIINNLLEMGIEVLVYENGLLLKEKIYEKPPNLLIVNVILPDLLGVDICEELKFSSNMRSFPIILIGEIYKIHRYHRKPKSLYGADEYIEEGISSQVFKSIVQRLLGLKFDSAFLRTPEEEHQLRRMRIFINEFVNEEKGLIEEYLNGGDKEVLKNIFFKAKFDLQKKEPDLSEEIMRSFLIQYLRNKLEEKKNG